MDWLVGWNEWMGDEDIHLLMLIGGKEFWVVLGIG